MAKQDDTFDDGLAAALRRTMPREGASPELRARIGAMLSNAAPVTTENAGDESLPLRHPAMKRPDRVFGMPRVWGLAAAVLMLLAGGTLLTYQLRDMFPTRVKYDPVAAVIGGLVQVHNRTPEHQSKVFTDFADFRRNLPSDMPVAALESPDAKFIGARVDQVTGQLCYAVRYAVGGSEMTLVTAAVNRGYAIPSYNQLEDKVRLVGGDKDGWLVCLMGDATVAESTFKSLHQDVKLLSSPSTQPVTALSAAQASCQ